MAGTEPSFEQGANKGEEDGDGNGTDFEQEVAEVTEDGDGCRNGSEF